MKPRGPKRCRRRKCDSTVPAVVQTLEQRVLLSATSLLSEDFEDGVADDFEVQSGTGVVTDGAYEVTADSFGDGVSTVNLSDPLPDEVDVLATINVDAASGLFYSNGLIIFDYQSATDFKFAGAFAGGDKWVIGHRTSSGWLTDASTAASIDALTDYNLRLEIASNGDATLHVDGAPMASFSFGDALTDGDVGVGTWNAVSRFDNVVVQEPASATASFPLTEDFEDGVADGFDVQSGSALVANGEYEVTAPPLGDGVSTINFSDPLPDEFEMLATINVDPSSSSRFSNGLIIFDYQSATDFKFAGAFAGGDKWVIGHRTSSGWLTDATMLAPIDAQTDYNLRLEIGSGGEATLHVDGAAMVSFTYAESLTDGDVGVGTWNAVARFDDVAVQQVAPPSVSFPLTEDFEDGVADGFEVQAGDATVTGGEYEVTAEAFGDGVSAINFSDPLPADFELLATINANAASGSFYSNGFLIFDYQSPTDFKFAGAYAGADQWVIGHRNAAGWVTDSVSNARIDAGTDYSLRLTVENGNAVTLFVDGRSRVSHDFASPVNDGTLGVGTRNAIARFDDVTAQELTPTTPGNGRARDFELAQTIREVLTDRTLSRSERLSELRALLAEFNQGRRNGGPFVDADTDFAGGRENGLRGRRGDRFFSSGRNAFFASLGEGSIDLELLRRGRPGTSFRR